MKASLTVETSANFPAYITATRSTNWAIKPISCVIMMMEALVCSCNFPIVSITWRWVTTSRALVGSSATITLGFIARPIAAQTRCFMPPESSCGYISATFRGKPTIRGLRKRARAFVPCSCAACGL